MSCINTTLPKWKNIMRDFNLTREDIHVIFNADTDINLDEDALRQKLKDYHKFNVYYRDRGEFKEKRSKYNQLAESLESENNIVTLEYSDEKFKELQATFGEDNVLKIQNKIIVKKPMLYAKTNYLSSREKAEAGIRLMQYNSKRISYHTSEEDRAINTVTNLAKKVTRTQAEADNFTENLPVTSLVSSTVGNAIDVLLRKEFEGVDCRTLTDIAHTNKAMRETIHAYAEQFRRILDEKFGEGNWHSVTSDLSLRSTTSEYSSVQGALDIIIYTNDGDLFIADFKSSRSKDRKDGKLLWDKAFKEGEIPQEVQYKRQVAAYTRMIATQYGDYFNSVKSLGLFVVPTEYKLPGRNEDKTREVLSKNWKVKINGQVLTESQLRNLKSWEVKGDVEISTTEDEYFEKIQDFVTIPELQDTRTKDNVHLVLEDLKEEDVKDLDFTFYTREDLKNIVDNTILGNNYIQRPSFRTTTSSLQESFYYNDLLSMEEKRFMANLAMTNASVLISRLQTDPKAKNIIPGLKEDVDLTKLDRKEVIEAVGGIKVILNAVRELYFNAEDPYEGTGGAQLLDVIDSLREKLESNPEDAAIKNKLEEAEKKAEKMLLINDNWKEFCRIGYAKLIELEGVSIISNDDSNFIKTEEIDFDLEKSLDLIEEQHWESWQQGNNNKSAVASLSTTMRRLYSRLLLKDKGKTVKDPYGYGIPMYVDSNEAVNSILEWCKECTTLEEMIKVLKVKEDAYNWVTSVLEMLGEKEGQDKSKFQTVRSQFFQNTRKDFTSYGIINFMADNYGNLTPVVNIINTASKEDYFLDNITASLITGKVSVFSYVPGSTTISGVINKDKLGELTKVRDAVRKALDNYQNALSYDNNDLEIEKDLSTLVSKVKEALSKYGVTIEDDFIRKSIISNITKSKSTFIDNILTTMSNIHNNFSDVANNPTERIYSPFDYNDDKSVKNRYKELVQAFIPYVPDTIESSVYENGKMYYSFVTPSSLGKTIIKLNNKNMKSDLEYLRSVNRDYGFSKWFKRGDDFNTPWLRKLVEKEGYRQILDHKVQLHSNRVAYRDMSKIAYAQSLLLEFFSDKRKNPSIRTAWYRVPILSNKPSSEFIQFERLEGNYGEVIAEELYKGALRQELARIRTVIQNAKSDFKGAKTEHFDLENVVEEVQNKIDNDEPLTAEDFSKLTTKSRNYGAEFKFLEFLNEHLRDGDSSLGKLLRDKINYGKITTESEGILENKFKKALNKFMEDAVNSEISYMESIGLFELEEDGNRISFKYLNSILPNSYSHYLEQALKSSKDKVADKILEQESKSKMVSAYLQSKNKNFVKEINASMYNLMRQDLEDKISEYVWNDSFASLNIIQLTVGDLAFFKNTEDFQKRFAQVHSPGLRLNTEATFNENGKTIKYSEDGINRSVYIKDAEHVVSEVYENIRMIFDDKIASSDPKHRKRWREIRDEALKMIRDINVTDGQAYSCPTSSRKKLAMAGKWTDAMEEAYKRIKSKNFTISDVELLIQPSKPFNSAYEKVRTNGPISTIKRSVQHKNSEYTLIVADALLNEGAGVLKAILDVMENSAFDNGEYNGKGIDTIMFGSCVKVGRSEEIDINNLSYEDAKAKLEKYIYGGKKVHSSNYNTNIVHETLFEDYMIQQEVPAHFVDHEQLFGSQFRILSISDITPETNFRVYNEDSGEIVNMDDKALKSEYMKLIAANIEESFKQLIEDFGLQGMSTAARNKRISEILQSNIAKDARYGHDLYMAVSLDANNEFNIPLSDPIQSIRIQQLLNSIIKSRINKQTLHGGPIVQTTSYGLDEDLNMVWKDSKGNNLQTFKEWKKSTGKTSAEEYHKYIKENGGQFAYFECYMPMPFDEDSDIYKAMLKPDGSFMTIEEAIAAGIMNEEQRKAIGYRIPTEDKYSMMPMYIKGFLPKSGGEAIMLPKEITALTGADFDIDKMYTIIKDYDISSKTIRGKATREKADIAQVVRDNLKESDLQEVDIPISLLDAVIKGRFTAAASESFTKLVALRLKGGDKFLTGKLSETSSFYKEAVQLENLVNNFVAKHEDKLEDKVTYPQEETKITVGKYGKGTKQYNNNRIFDLQWAVLTNNDTLTKLFRPQSFEEQRRSSKLVNAAKALRAKGKKMELSKLESYDNDELDEKIIGNLTNNNILFTSTQIKYHNQNMVAGTLIGIFANNNVSHAFLQHQDIKLHFTDNKGFVFDNVLIDNGSKSNSLSNIYDREGDLISRRIASFLGASVDAVKDPILNYLNLNTATAGVAMLLTRLGFHSDSISFLLTQPVIEELCAEYFKLSNEGYVSMGDLIDLKFKELFPGESISSIDLKSETFTKKELYNRLLENKNDEFDAKVLALFKTLYGYAQHLNTLTFMTKFNSVSNAVGPTIADTMVMESRVERFKQLMKDSETAPFNSNATKVIENSPILEAFYDYTIGKQGAANKLFSPYFPHYSNSFKEVLNTIISNTKSPLDAKTINTIVSDYMYYCMTRDVFNTDANTRKYYVHDFPIIVSKSIGEYSGIPALRNMYVSPSKGKKKPIVTVNTSVGGMKTEQQEEAKASWADLLSSDNQALRQLGFEKAMYMIIKNGFSFSPTGDMHLLGTAAKQMIPGYIETLRDMDNFYLSDGNSFINQLVRNRHSNIKLVPHIKHFKNVKVEFKDGKLVLTGDTKDLHRIVVKKEADGTPKFSNYIKYKNKLYIYNSRSNSSLDNDVTVKYSEISTLGVTNNIIEYNIHEGTKIESVVPMAENSNIDIIEEADFAEEYYDESPSWVEMTNQTEEHQDDKVFNPDTIVKSVFSKGGKNVSALEARLEGRQHLIGQEDNDDISNEPKKDLFERIDDLAANETIISDPLQIIELYNDIVDYNMHNPDKVASMAGVGKNKIVIVSPRTVENINIPQQVQQNANKQEKLKGILNRAGFDVAIDDTLTEGARGVFDPTRAETNTSNLLTVIRIAKEEFMEEAFPEEYAHFIIEGMKNHGLVNRILDTLRKNNELVKEILGDQYDHYEKVYNGDIRLIKEAAGKLLAQYINGDRSTLNALVSRLNKVAMDKFSSISEQEVQELLVSTELLSDLAQSDDVVPLIDARLVMTGKPLYQLENSLQRLRSQAELGIKVKSRRMRSILSKKKGGFEQGHSKQDIKHLAKMQQALDEDNYVNSVGYFLQDAVSIMKDLRVQVLSLNPGTIKSSSNSLHINKCCAALNNIREFLDGYEEIIDDIVGTTGVIIQDSENSDDSIYVGLENLHGIAQKTIEQVKALRNLYNDSKMNASYAFLKMYWGEDKDMGLQISKYKGEKLVLEELLKEGLRDLGLFDRWFSSMSDANDPLLSTLDKAVKLAQAERDNILQQLIPTIRQAHLDFVKEGGNPDFIYERDENGVPTGRYKSDINYDKYYKERKEEINRLKELGLKGYELRLELQKWENSHNERVLVDPTYGEEGRWEMRPKKELYRSNALSELTATERKYYDFIMDAKAKIDSLLPQRYVSQHKAVQMRSDVTETLLASKMNAKNKMSSIFKSFKEKFLLTEDDEAEFGEQDYTEEDPNNPEDADLIDDLDVQDEQQVSDDDTANESKKEKIKRKIKNNRFISLDASGKRRIRKVPVFYTRFIKDKNRLSTDLTGSLIAYTAMAVNYSEMNKIVDCLELVKDQLSQRKVRQLSGDQQLVETYSVLGKLFTDNYTAKGRRIEERLEDYFDSVIYGQHKRDEGQFRILGKKMSAAKTLDSLKEYSGQLGLALNLFSGISNVTIGKVQLFIESRGKEYFTYKDMSKAKVEYYKLLLPYMGQCNAVNPDNKLKLLMDRFDVTDSFYNDLQNNNVYNSSIVRLLGNSSLMFLNSAGEHYLRNRTMLAMLYNYKVIDKKTKKEVSLYDALVKKEIYKDSTNKEVVGNRIMFDNEKYSKKDGSEFTEADFANMRLRISKVNGSLNGQFGETDKGAIHRYALGRLAMQFRQWMPGHYYRRFAGTYYDAQLDQMREGYYRTLWSFTKNTLKDLKKLKFTAITNFSKLTDYEKGNMRRAFAEQAVFAVLAALCCGLGPVKDLKKGPWAERMLAYTILRMKMEVSASNPLNIQFFNNIVNTLNSPAAALNSIDRLSKLVMFWNAFDIVESGRWEGYPAYVRDFIRAIPPVDKIINVVDLDSSDGDRMFSYFSKN